MKKRLLFLLMAATLVTTSIAPTNALAATTGETELNSGIETCNVENYTYFKTYGYIGYGFTTRGEGVARAQAILNGVGMFLRPEYRYSCECGEVDGIFGDKTKQAVENFQEYHHLRADGIIGPDTWNKLEGWHFNHGI